MTRSFLVFAAAVLAALTTGCATPGTQGTPTAEKGSNPTDYDYAVRDMVRPPGMQIGNTMNKIGR